MEYPQVYLKPHSEKRVEEGHLWVFSNEIDKAEEDVTPGGLVDIYSARKQFVGRGFCNPHSLIALRILTHKPEEIDEAFIEARIRNALFLREELFPGETAYRLVFGESDFLPGLIIDRFGDVFVVQSYCLGIDLLLPIVYSALKKIFSPKAIYNKSDSSMRAMEGAKDEVGFVDGKFEGPIEITQGFHGNKLKFMADPQSGQKSGFFFDQRENRVRLTFYAKGKSVLDCYSYVGSFGVYAAQGGAASVTSIDSSAPACDLIRKNYAINGLKGNVLQEDVEAALAGFQAEKKKFDIIVLDPPALAKTKKTVFAGLRKYGKLNELAIACLNKGGILISCSCSHHIRRDDFLKMINSAAAEQKRTARLLEMRGQSRDHPIHLAMPETEYLKCAIVKID